MAHVNTTDIAPPFQIKDETGVDFTPFLQNHLYSMGYTHTHLSGPMTIGQFTTFTVLREHSYSMGYKDDNLNSSIKIEHEWDTNSKEFFLDYKLQEMLSTQNQAIKVEGSNEMDGIVKSENTEHIDVKWEIKDEELNIKKEENITDEEYRLYEISSNNHTEIKPEESKKIDGIENIEDSVDVKWEIVNKELNLEEDNVTDKDYRLYGSEVKLEGSEDMGDIQNIEETVDLNREIEKNVQNIKEKEDITYEEHRMPGYYQLKNRKEWIERSVKAALLAIEEGILTYRAAATEYNVSVSTLQRYRNKQITRTEIRKRADQYKNTFTAGQTTDFIKYLTECDSRGLILTLVQVGKLAFQFAEENGIDHMFNRETKAARVAWCRAFTAANNLTFKNSVATSLVPRRGLSKVAAWIFFTILRDVKRKYNFRADRIYNAVEINLCLISTDEQVERNRITTLVCAVNAVGSSVPPFFVFALHKMKPGFLNGCPSGSGGIAQPSGWLTAESFLAYLKHFAKYAKPSIDDPVLLLIDSRCSHISLLGINFSRDNGIILIGFPAHTKPSRVFSGPLDTLYNHSKTVTCDRNLLPSFTKAYYKAASKSAVRGFKASGIEPFNPLIFGFNDICSIATTENDGPLEVIQPVNFQPNIDNEDHVAKKIKLVKSMEMDISKRADQFKNTFTAEQTTDYVKYLTECDSRGLILTLVQVRKLAFQFAEENGIDHMFNRETKTADVAWWRAFSEANNLTFRNSVATSIVPLKGFNNVAAQIFFKILRVVKRKYNFKADRIYNAGEINICLISTDEELVSTERNCTTTLVCAVNAEGSFVPPFFAFALHRMKPELLDGCPCGSEGIAHPSGWITAESFLTYLKHFAKYAKPSIDDPVLLLVDSRSSHISLLGIDFSRDNGIILIGFPAHTKPSRVFSGPLDTLYNHSKTVTCDRNLFPSFTKAYCNAAGNNAVRGFKESGIEPFNPPIFGVNDICSTGTTENGGPLEVIEPVNLQSSNGNEDHVAKKIKLVECSKQRILTNRKTNLLLADSKKLLKRKK